MELIEKTANFVLKTVGNMIVLAVVAFVLGPLAGLALYKLGGTDIIKYEFDRATSVDPKNKMNSHENEAGVVFFVREGLSRGEQISVEVMEVSKARFLAGAGNPMPELKDNNTEVSDSYLRVDGLTLNPRSQNAILVYGQQGSGKVTGNVFAANRRIGQASVFTEAELAAFMVCLITIGVVLGCFFQKLASEEKIFREREISEEKQVSNTNEVTNQP